MKPLIYLLIVIALVGLGLGYYLGWFNVSSQDAAGKATVTVTVDKDKVAADKDKAVETLKDIPPKSNP